MRDVSNAMSGTLSEFFARKFLRFVPTRIPCLPTNNLLVSCHLGFCLSQPGETLRLHIPVDLVEEQNSYQRSPLNFSFHQRKYNYARIRADPPHRVLYCMCSDIPPRLRIPNQSAKRCTDLNVGGLECYLDGRCAIAISDDQ